MDISNSQYHRAVTPTLEKGNDQQSRARVVSYQSNQSNRNKPTYTSTNNGKPSFPINSLESLQSRPSTRPNTSVPLPGSPASYSNLQMSGKTFTRPSQPNSNDLSQSSVSGSSIYLRSDLIPFNEEVPADGIIFSRMRSNPDVIVVIRTPEERYRNPERLNLDRRQLEACPIIEQEQRLRLLNYQNNSIRSIQNVENLPNLIFLDLYNNKLTSLEGPISSIKGLRVLMAGKNRIQQISNLEPLKKLDVLDLHSNEIRSIQGLSTLQDLRVLNLAGNRINIVHSLESLHSLTELNLRRNAIERVEGLDNLPALQRVFLSHNQISDLRNVRCLFLAPGLVELSLDGNPVTESDPVLYRASLIAGMPELKHLDLKKISEEEREQVKNQVIFNQPISTSSSSSSSSDSMMNLTLSFLEEKINALTLHSSSSTSFDGNRTGSTNSSSENGNKKQEQQQREEGGLVEREGLRVDGDVKEEEAEEERKRMKKSEKEIEKERINEEQLTYRGGEKEKALINMTGPLRSSYNNNNNNNNNIHHNSSSLFNSTSSSFSTHIPPSAQLFEFETLDSNLNTKELLISGDTWEWLQPRRLYLQVTSVTLCHMKKDLILSKFFPCLSWLPQFESLKLINNDIRNLKDLDRILSVLAPYNPSSLHILDNPISPSLPSPSLSSSSSNSSSSLTRALILSRLPNLKSLNDTPILPSDQSQASSLLGPLLLTLQTNQNALEEKEYQTSSNLSRKDVSLSFLPSSSSSQPTPPPLLSSSSSSMSKKNPLSTPNGLNNTPGTNIGGLSTSGVGMGGSESLLLQSQRRMLDLVAEAVQRREGEEQFNQVVESVMKSIIHQSLSRSYHPLLFPTPLSYSMKNNKSELMIDDDQH